LVADNKAAGQKPLVIVIHNFCGQTRWHVHVAEYMARLGYVGLAVDFYSPSLVPHALRALPKSQEEGMANVQKIFKDAMLPIEANEPLQMGILQKWIDAGCAHPAVDAEQKPAAIGYCLGGLFVLDAVRAGLPLGGVVSFHGVLRYDLQPDEFMKWVGSFMTIPEHIPAPRKYSTETLCLVENGENDSYGKSPLRDTFEKEMADAGVKLQWHELEGAGHGFALAPCVWGGREEYHEAADRQSTLNMLQMFKQLWPQVGQRPVHQNAAGTVIIEKSAL